MKIVKYAQLILVFSIILFIGCDGPERMPSLSFTSPFPGKNRNLTSVFGEYFRLQIGKDTLLLSVTSDHDHNLILNTATNDTVFYGKASRYRGMLYFTYQLNDSSYWIYAVKVKKNLVYGLSDVYAQLQALKNAVTTDPWKKVLVFAAPDSSVYRMTPDKKLLRTLYTGVVEGLVPDTLIEFEEISYERMKEDAMAEEEPEADNLLESLYPVPVDDVMTVRLSTKASCRYEVIDDTGRQLITGTFNGEESAVNTSGLKKGAYFFILEGPGGTRDFRRFVKN